MRVERARRAVRIWSDADHQRASERLVCEISQATPAEPKHFDKLFQHRERQQLQQVGTKATGPRSIFAKLLAQMTTAAKEEAHKVANMTADKHV